MHQLCIPGTDLAVSSLCYGVAGFGTVVRDAAMDALFTAFVERGGNFFDTAHCYAFWLPDGLGASERALGSCLRRYGRAGMVVATKGGHPDGGPGYPRPDGYLAPEVVARDIAESLDRLGLDHIDLYFLHRDDQRVPVGELLDGLNAELRAGRLRALGASNWTTARLDAAHAYAAAHGLHGFVAAQSEWNLAQQNRLPAGHDDRAMRALTPADIAWHETSRLPLLAYSSTARGYFATGGQAAAGDYDNPVSRARLARVQQLAAEFDCSPNLLALAALLHRRFPVIPLLGTTDLSHLVDALDADTVPLTARQRRWLWEGR